MKIAIFSDIHANEVNLLKGLQDMKEKAADEIWCLGDLVGYGNSPRRVVSLVHKKCDLVIAGNHDFAVSGRFPGFIEGVPSWLSSTLNKAISEVSREDTAWLESLAPMGSRHGIKCFHGSPEDPVSGYVVEENAKNILESLQSDISLCGHSHVPFAFSLSSKQLRTFYPDNNPSTISLSAESKHILNPGSLGLKQYSESPIKDRSSRWMMLDVKESIVLASWHKI